MGKENYILNADCARWPPCQAWGSRDGLALALACNHSFKKNNMKGGRVEGFLGDTCAGHRGWLGVALSGA